MFPTLVLKDGMGTIRNSGKKKLDRIHNGGLRIITGNPENTSVTAMETTENLTFTAPSHS